MPSLARTIIRSGLITGSVPGCSYSVTSFQAALESPFSKSVHTAISPSATLFDLPRCLLLFLIGLLFVVVKSNTKYPTCQACFFIFFIPFSGKGSFLYIFGANPNWGIYLCEYPAIKLIGCVDRYIPAFKDAFNIRGTGFEEVEPLLEQEFGQNRNFQNKLIENYHL